MALQMNNGKNKGSEWRVWDLHVHSPATYGGEYATFIDNLKKSRADVIGINDYSTLNGYKEVVSLGGVPGKIIFPVIEFRMHNIVANRKNADPTKSGTKINFHVIFNNDPSLLDRVLNWLNSLECFDERGSLTQLGVAKDLGKISVDFRKVIDSLKTINLYNDCLIWLPYDEYGGIDDIDPMDNFFKLSLIKEAHLIGSSTLKQIAFFKWQDLKFTDEQYSAWFDAPKPCIKGSDAHKINYPFGQLQNHLSQPIDKYCWINADATFKGLKQIIVEPERVYIGFEPELLDRVRNNKTKFVKSLSIKKTEELANGDIWFDDFYVEINSGLVAIIGNKGGGKSAITDIISLCGNTYQDATNFSFLTSAKFRKAKPFNLSEKFEATLTWEDGTESKKKLNENPDKNSAERVKYIPQNFLERLCTNIESDEFERELKQIIFSHTPPDKRLGKVSLDELINYKSSLVNDEITKIQSQIGKLNTEITELEAQATEGYKKSIENQINLKRGELSAHISIKPQKPEVETENDDSKKLIEGLTTLRKQIKEVEDEIATLKKDKSTFSVQQEELNRSLQYYKNLDEQLKKVNDPSNEFAANLLKNGVIPSDVFSYKIDLTKISETVNGVNAEIQTIDKALDGNDENSKTCALKNLNEKLKQGQEELDKPAKEHQSYLDNLKSWETKQAEIEGNPDTEGSLKFYEGQLEYINIALNLDLTGKYKERKELVAALYSQKLLLIEIRKELFQPVTQFINDFKELKKRYDVTIDVNLELRAFADNFFNFISQNRIGTFNGREEGYKRLSEIIERADFSTSDGFIAFTEELIDSLKNDKRATPTQPVEVINQLKKGIEVNKVYDFIFNADYLQPIYNLKLGSKTLQELSPGERGALLLIFYLILDNDDIPLIIDQPEENLDNESVYHILVHFIKRTKEKRQIVIVTHNPNLAIVCDADQIINMQIDKENKNTVQFLSGAIEDSIMNKAIINILEGTLPAFNNRDSKYIR